MASDYQLLPAMPGAMEMVLRYADSAHIPFDGGNRDYLQYVADGGTTDPVPTPPEPPPPEPLELPAEPTEDMHAATKGYVDTEVATMGARVNALERWAAPYQQQQQPRPS
jgi:hypothetical protein